MDKLDKNGRKFFKQISEAHGINSAAGTAILTQVAEAFQRLQEAQKVLTEEGIIVLDRFKQQKPHPATIIEKDCRSQIFQGLKQLNVSYFDDFEEEDDFSDL